MICRHCGTEIADKALICFRCGEATEERTQPARAARRPLPRAGPTLVAIGLALAAVLVDQSSGEAVPAGVAPALFILALVALGWGFLTRR